MKAAKAAARLFEENTSPAELWKALEEERLTLLSVSEERGGHGGTLADAAAVLRLMGRRAASAPVAETALLSGWTLASSDLDIPGGVLVAAPVRPGERIEVRREGNSRLLYGQASRVPWARDAAWLAVVCRSGGEALVAIVDRGKCRITTGENVAGEPRDCVVFDGVPAEAVARAPEGVDEEGLLLRGALARSVLMTGAMEETLNLSLRHAKERRQFGCSIGRFQAIQQHLTLLAGEAAAVEAATEAAVEAIGLAETPRDALFEVASAKLRVSEAARVVASVAHQVHGAIGFTERHTLHHSTLRLWSWREEFGSESEWAACLGSMIARRGPAELWPTITAPPPALGWTTLRRPVHATQARRPG